MEVTKEKPIDASNVTPETIRSGLFRDILFASMIGTPEMGVYKIAKRKCKDEDLSTEHMVLLKGYHSGIEPGPNGSIGYGYPFLRKLYGEARKFIEQRATKEEKQAGEEHLEHRAVLLASEWLTEAMDYNDPGRTPHSPYASGIEEAVAWARLGDEHIKDQLRGMRRKISGVNLRNIERFIGKSGPNKYEKERRRLYGMLKILTEGDEHERQDLLERENDFMQKWQVNWFAHEKERLEQKFEKAQKQIEQKDLSDEEREFRLTSLKQRFDTQIANLEAEYRQKLDYFQNRTVEQLLSDLKERQEVVKERYEKHKNLAQKALDLHFQINHRGGDHDSEPLDGIVDWINYAPFGTIKRSHKMMRLGMSDEQIVEYALADIIAGKRGATRDDLGVVHKLAQEARDQDWEAQEKLERMMKVGNIVSLSNYEISLQEVEELAEKDFRGMTDVLREYSLDDVKWFMDQDLYLRSVAAARKATKKQGYDLDNTVIAEIASHDIAGLDDALSTFGLAETRNLLSRDVSLPMAIAIRDNTKAHGHKLSIDQIATIAKGVENVDDFIFALHSLPFKQVEQLYNAGQQYEHYKVVRSALVAKNQDASFANSLAWTQRLARYEEWHQLSDALNTFSPEELEQINDEDIPILKALDIHKALTELDLENSVSDIVRWSKVTQRWTAGRVIEIAAKKFGINNLLRIVEKEIPLQNALNVKYEIDRRGLHQFDTLEMIMTIAKRSNNVEIVLKTLDAGFTIEEITRYPFLVSHLVAQR